MIPHPFLPGLDLQRDVTDIDAAADELEHYPDVTPAIIQANAKAIGLSGELFVDSLLIRHGQMVLPVPESMPFDRLVCIEDRHIKIQIKTTTRPKGGYYSFTLQKGYHRSKRGIRRYDAEDYDLAALVILPQNVVFFSPEHRSSHRIAVREVAFLRADPLASYRRAIDTLLSANGPEQDDPPPGHLGIS